MNWPSPDANGILLGDPVSVRYQSVVVIFARAQNQTTGKLYYNIRVESAADQSDYGAFTGWYELDLTQTAASAAIGGYQLPQQLRVMSMSLIGVSPVATTPTPANAPFRVVSDDKYLYIYRLSTDGTLYLNRFVLIEAPAQPEIPGRTSPQVSAQFVMQPAWELRYQRSGLRDTPAGPDDVLAYRDMNGNPFIEPTMEIGGLPSVTAGNFTVLLVLNGEARTARWQFFIANTATSTVTALSFPQADDGLIDITDPTASSFTMKPVLSTGTSTTEPLTLTGGVSATLYGQQEPQDSSDPDSETLRRAAHVLVAAPVSASGAGLASAMAFYDFSLGSDGILPALPAGTASILLDGSIQNNHFVPTTLASYPVPPQAVIVVGTGTIAATALGQVQPTATPNLLDSGDGMVHCYYPGQPNGAGGNPFLVAQFSPYATRSVATATWTAATQQGSVDFVVSRAGSTTTGMSIAIADAGTGPLTGFCKVTIEYGSASGIGQETFQGVPRQLDAFLGVLNGAASRIATQSGVLAGDVTFFDYSGTRPIVPLPQGSATSPTGTMLLVSARPDVVLTSARLVASGSAIDMVLALQAGANSLQQTWNGLPTDAANANVILNGDAAPSTYAYTPASTDSVAFALSTTGGSILLFLKSGLSAANTQIAVTPAANGDPTKVDATVTAGSTSLNYQNIDSSQAGFIAALQANSQFASIVPVVSPDPIPGTVLPQQTSGALNLSQLATLFNVIPPTSTDPLVPATVTASAFQSHSQNAPQVADPLPDRMVAMEAFAVTRPDNGVPPVMDDGTYSSSGTPSNGQWVAANPLYALSATGQGYMSVPTGGVNFGLLAPTMGMTVEAWVMPTDGTPASICTFNNGTAPACSIQPSYSLGVAGQACVQFAIYSGVNQQYGAFVEVQSAEGFDPANGSFTWEAWVKPASPVAKAGTRGSVVQVYDPNNSAVPPFEMALDTSLRPTVLYSTGQNNGVFNAPTALAANTWSHLAVTASKQGTSYQYTIYVNAEAVFSTTVTAQGATVPPLAYLGGGSGALDSSFAGSLAEVRCWQACRTQPELRRTLYTTLQGTEPGLFGYWLLVENPSTTTMHNSCLATGSALNGAAKNSSVQQISQSSDGTFLSMTVGMAGAPAFNASAFLRSNHWNHVAAVYQSGPAVAMNPAASFNLGRLDYADCGSSNEFDVATSLSADAWVQFCSPINSPQTILSKWDAELSGQSFWFGVNASGSLSVQLVLNIQTLTAPLVFGPYSFGPSLADSNPHHVAFTYASATGVDNNNDPITQGTLTLFVDGKQVGTQSTAVYQSPATTVPLQTTDGPVRIGVAAVSDTPGVTVAIESNQFFHGSLTGVRLWSVALTLLQVQQAMLQAQNYSASGAISAWWFTEQKGLVAADSISKNDARLSNPDFWGPFPRLATVTCYANGMLLGVTTPLATNPPGYLSGSPQCTFGGAIVNNALVQPWNGGIDEVRVWNVARTQTEILDYMYSSLMGNETGLAGYWNFDDRSVNDQTGHGNNGVLQGAQPPTVVLSAAPVADEGPRVLNIYGGQPTDFQTTAIGTPAVIEYGDARLAPGGAPSAVLKRGYYYASQNVALEPGFLVGVLDLVYLGQVQTDATLQGYIEGAPPVPSENLSRPFYNTTASGYTGYFNASTITLNEADSTNIQFSSSDTTGIVAFDIAASLGFNYSDKAAAGAVIWKKFASVDLQVGGKYKGNLTLGKTAAETYGSQWTKTITDTLSLRGDWEPGQSDSNLYVNPTVGRRFLPANSGYALVTSLTADLYVMMLKQTGAMVGRITIPNPDIPPDNNIIPFQIDAGYIKNGTLDGKVGLVNDPTYPNADFQRGSYFKPKEAYQLKDQIERGMSALKMFYDQFNAVQAGQSRNTDLSGAEAKQFVAFGGDTPLARQSLVNQYVWTASGGLHAEQEQFSSQKVSSHSGSFKMSNTAGVGASLKTGVYGLFSSVDFLAGQTIDVTVTKSETDTSQFGLNVAVTGEPLLLGYDPTLNNGAGGYTSEACPGKVDTYRFYTYYLAPSTDNAEVFSTQVVDQNWLRSADANAVALRSASIGGQSVWRVLHRVTYVSRVPPPYATRPAQRVSSQPARAINIDDNAQLIVLVQQTLGQLPPTPVNVSNALVTVMNPPSPATPLLNAILPWWQGFLNQTRGATPNPQAVALLASIFNQTLSYLLAGYSTGVLPIKLPAVAGARSQRRTAPQKSTRSAAAS